MIEQSRFITTSENSEHNIETKNYVCTIMILSYFPDLNKFSNDREIQFGQK